MDELQRSIAFYTGLLGCEVLVRDERFCALAITERQVLLLFLRGGTPGPVPVEGGNIPPHDAQGRQHFGFSIAAADLQEWEHHLARLAIAVESRIRWPRGGTSLYFRDPDQHLVELITPGLWRVY